MQTRHFLVLFGASIVVYMCIWYEISDSQSIRKYTTELKITSEDTVTLDSTEEMFEDTSIEAMFNRSVLSGKRPVKKAFLTIGIPCMYRQNNTIYLVDTIKSLLANTNATEKKEIIIVVLLADLNKTVQLDMNALLLKMFEPHFTSGLIHTIRAPMSFYPSFDKLKITYNHPIQRVKWRSKQNFDYAFLMLYSKELSEYYLQLEDDLVTVPGYLSIIKTYMRSIRRWTCLEFCELGFIAKLYHSYDLSQLANMLMLFFNEQPNDVLYLHFNEVMLQFKRFIHKPTIFQHRGFYSSLSLKRFLRIDLMFNASAVTEATLDKDDKLLDAKDLPVHRRQLNRIPGPESQAWAARFKRQKKLDQKMVIA